MDQTSISVRIPNDPNPTTINENSIGRPVGEESAIGLNETPDNENNVVRAINHTDLMKTAEMHQNLGEGILSESNLQKDLNRTLKQKGSIHLKGTRNYGGTVANMDTSLALAAQKRTLFKNF